MNKTATRILFALMAISVVVTGASCYQAHERWSQSRQRELDAMIAMIDEDQEILRALQRQSSESGILGSYLAKIRADGVAKHAEAKQKLDRLAENNAGILALINAYRSNSRTGAFNAEAEKFQRYAISWRDRWNSVMELYMAGGNYPAAEVAFPTEFIDAVQVELNSTQ